MSESLNAIPQIVPGQKIGYHPVAQMFPLIVGDQFAVFCEDIRLHGQREPIVYVVGDDGTWLIVDGRNRYRASESLGVLPDMHEWDGVGSLADYAVSLNMRRRHLTPSQRAAAAVAIKRQFAVEAEARMVAGTRPIEGADDPVQKVGQGKRAPTSRQRAAEACDVNPTYIDDAEKVAEQLAALRRAADHDAGRMHADRSTCRAVRDRGLAVELDANGRHVFDHPVYGERVYESIESGETRLGEAYAPTRFYITHAGRRRAERAADLVGATADGRPVDTSLMEDL